MITGPGGGSVRVPDLPEPGICPPVGTAGPGLSPGEGHSRARAGLADDSIPLPHNGLDLRTAPPQLTLPTRASYTGSIGGRVSLLRDPGIRVTPPHRSSKSDDHADREGDQLPQVRSHLQGEGRDQGPAPLQAVSGDVQRRVSRRELEREARRGRSDQKAATKLFIAGAFVLALLGGVALLLNSQTSPIAKTTHAEPPPRRESRIPQAPVPKSDRPREVALKFLNALAAEDEDAIRELFLFQRYSDWAVQMYRLPEGDPRRFDSGTPEEQAARKQEFIEEVLQPERCQFIKQFLLPSISDGTETLLGSRGGGRKSDSFEWLIKDGDGKDIMNLKLTIALRAGLDPALHNQDLKSWGVMNVQDMMHITTLEIDRPDKRALDPIGRARKEEITKRRRAAKGPPEEDPKVLDPLDGTGATQTSLIQGAIADLLNRESSGPAVYEAGTKLINMGKPRSPTSSMSWSARTTRAMSPTSWPRSTRSRCCERSPGSTSATARAPARWA